MLMRAGGFLDTRETAAVLGDGEACVTDLPYPNFAPELVHQLELLAQTGGADGMAFGFQSAGEVDGDFPAQPGMPPLSKRTAFAESAEAQILGLQNFCQKIR